MIKVNNLSRNYETKTGFLKKTKEIKKAVNSINFNVDKGEIFGLLGPNGAGKTTTIKILTTLLLPTDGNVEVFGLDICEHKKAIRKRINFIYGGERSLYWRLSAKDNLMYFSDLYNVDNKVMENRIEDLLALVGLSNYSGKRVETFSKGMKQRLQIARALINDPDIIFMDEPTIGLDPAASKLLHEIIIMLKEQGKTILITTHYMKEAEVLCDRIAFINNGEIIEINTPKGHRMSLQEKIGKEVIDLEEVYLAHFGEKRSVE